MGLCMRVYASQDLGEREKKCEREKFRKKENQRERETERGSGPPRKVIFSSHSAAQLLGNPSRPSLSIGINFNV